MTLNRKNFDNEKHEKDAPMNKDRGNTYNNKSQTNKYNKQGEEKSMNNHKSHKYQHGFNPSHGNNQHNHDNNENDYSLNDYAKAFYNNLQEVFTKEILPEGIDFKTALENTANSVNNKLQEKADKITTAINDYNEEIKNNRKESKSRTFFDNEEKKQKDKNDVLYISNLIAHIASHYTDNIELDDDNNLYIYVDCEKDGIELVESVRSVFPDDLLRSLDFEYYVITDYNENDSWEEGEEDNDESCCCGISSCNPEEKDFSEKNEYDLDILDLALISIAEEFDGRYNEEAKTISFPDEETKNEYYLFIAELFDNESVLDLITGEDDKIENNEFYGDNDKKYDESYYVSTTLDNGKEIEFEIPTFNSLVKKASEKLSKKINGFIDSLEASIENTESNEKDSEEGKVIYGCCDLIDTDVEDCCEEECGCNCNNDKGALAEEIFAYFFPNGNSTVEYDCIDCDCCEVCVHCVNCGKCDTCDNQPTFE